MAIKIPIIIKTNVWGNKYSGYCDNIKSVKLLLNVTTDKVYLTENKFKLQMKIQNYLLMIHMVFQSLFRFINSVL